MHDTMIVIEEANWGKGVWVLANFAFTTWRQHCFHLLYSLYAGGREGERGEQGVGTKNTHLAQDKDGGWGWERQYHNVIETHSFSLVP